MHDVEKDHSNSNVEKWALVAKVKVQASPMENSKTRKESLHRLFVEEETRSGTDRKCLSTGDMYSVMSGGHVETASEPLKSVPTCCARKRQSFVSLKL